MLPVHDLDVPASERRFHTTSGRVSLDLVATIGERWHRRFERLRGPDDLDRWLDAVELSAAEAADTDDLAAMRRLRGAVEVLAIAAMTGDAYPAEPVEVVNADARGPEPWPQLVDATATTVVPSHAATRAAIARDAIVLLGGDEARRIRECAADGCALLFLDASRPGNRRWCSMGACGNRHKVARHRARQASGAHVRSRTPE